jgi:CheY-like chemotaxis protein
MTPAQSAEKAANEPQVAVLVVEPDVIVRLAIADYLRDCGYRVLEAISAEEALKILEAGHQPEVVFSEVALPDMSGFALAKLVRDRYPAIDVILAGSPTAAAEKAADLCDEGPIEKPYKPEDVVRRIRLLREAREAGKDP